MARQVDDQWPLVFIGKRRPHGRKGQRCRRVRRSEYSDEVTLVKFATDGRTCWVLDRMLVKAENY